MALTIADLNEFHPLGDAHAYASGSPVIILRAHNGYRADNVYASNVAAVYAEPGIASCGHYGDLPADVDAHAAGVAFGETVRAHGGLRRQDFIACDLEVGSGDESARMAAWLDGAHSVLGEQAAQDWGYSGASFWSAHLAGATVVNRWIAAYGQAQAPTLGEKLWQDTDAGSFPGVPSKCDGSKFAGTLADFLTLIGAGAQVAAAAGGSAPFVGMAEAPGGAGYWLVAADGGVFSHGVPFRGSVGGAKLAAPAVGIAPGLSGYWLAAADGGVFNFGERFFGSAGGVKLAAPVVAIVPLENGLGYYLVAADGGVFAYGAAHIVGSAAGYKLAKPIVGAARCPGSPGGLWLAAADGGVFCLNAPMHGSAAGSKLSKPVVGIAAAPGGGYWLAAADGGVFAYGAPFFGSVGVKLAAPVVGIQASPSGKGYALVAADGGVFCFGDFRFAGSGAK